MSMHSCGKPYSKNITSGETVYICQCGATKTPPFCDGSHNEHPGKEPLVYTAQLDETLYICSCGKTGNSPWCDGSHQS